LTTEILLFYKSPASLWSSHFGNYLKEKKLLKKG